MTVSLRPAARQDIAAAIAYLHQHSPSQAPVFQTAFMDALRTLQKNPSIGGRSPLTNHLLSNIRRYYIECGYFIFYNGSTDGIEIVRVLHERRDLKDIFS